MKFDPLYDDFEVENSIVFLHQFQLSFEERGSTGLLFRKRFYLLWMVFEIG